MQGNGAWNGLVRRIIDEALRQQAAAYSMSSCVRALSRHFEHILRVGQ